MIRRERWWCEDDQEWHDADSCTVCLTEALRFGYGEVRPATRIMEARVGSAVIFRGKCCEAHPTRDDLAAAGLRMDVLPDLVLAVVGIE